MKGFYKDNPARLPQQCKAMDIRHIRQVITLIHAKNGGKIVTLSPLWPFNVLHYTPARVCSQMVHEEMGPIYHFPFIVVECHRAELFHSLEG